LSLFLLHQSTAAISQNAFFSASKKDSDVSQVVTIDISKMTRPQVDKLKLTPQINWWAEFGNALVLASNTSTLRALHHRKDIKVQKHWNNLNVKKLEVALAAHSHDIPHGYDVIAKAVVRLW